MGETQEATTSVRLTQFPEKDTRSDSGSRSPERLYPTVEDDSSIRGIVEYYRILCRRKGALILITVLGGLTALLLTLPQTPIYQGKHIARDPGDQRQFPRHEGRGSYIGGQPFRGVLHSNPNTDPEVEITPRPSHCHTAPGGDSNDR